MKRELLKYLFIVPLVVLFAVVATDTFAGGSYTMKGTISAVELEYNTVVVEVPQGNGESFTVGGPLVADAVLQKDGREADLEAYSVGDPVSVTWRSTSKGHVIEKLTTR